MMIMVSVALLIAACSPVLNRELMRQGTRDVSLNQLRETPDSYKGRLFIFGGVVVNTRLTDTVSQIEALYYPVDSYGYIKEGEHAQGRFLAVYPRTRGLLDPVVFRTGREITLAGEFLEMRRGKIDEMEYTFPVFEIRQIYLWEEERYNRYSPYYYPYYPYYNYPFFYDPWGRPYPNAFWPMEPW
jgi:outer membrane lipoprotein